MKDDVRYLPVSGTPGLVLGQARLSEFQFDRHYHEDYHIGLVTQGVQRQHFRGQSILLGPGGIALMPPGEIHDGMGADDQGSAYVLKTFRISAALMRTWIEDVSDAAAREHFFGTLLQDAALAQRFMALHNVWMSRAPDEPLARQSQSLALMADLFLRTRTVTPQVVKGGLSAAHRLAVRDYCHAHLSEKIALDDLARLCGLSRFQFLRRFTHTAGLTPHAWLVRLRLERACAVLATARMSVAEVAAEVGFYDQSHFNRAFRAAYGAPPSAYQPAV
ncbi:helix-turn-helix domain-containing protein [Achromobacter spanius]|uniref:AraC family transcriptional regulator n=1 Tax=Achromobacter spanius TaxID=217203 RepID=UPI003A8E2391